MKRIWEHSAAELRNALKIAEKIEALQTELRSFARSSGLTQPKANHFNRRIWFLWRNHGNRRYCGANIPKFVADFGESSGLLFLSLNPSFPSKDPTFVSDIDDAFPYKFSWKHSGLVPRFDPKTARRSALLHYCARWHYGRFFSRLNELARFLGVEVNDYFHVDLLFRLGPKPIPRNRNGMDFFEKEQHKLAMEIVSAIRPKLIVCVYKKVGNTFARICSEKGLQCEFNPVRKLGPPLRMAKVKLPNGDTVPVFSCSDLPASRNPFTSHAFRMAKRIIKRQWDEANSVR